MKKPLMLMIMDGFGFAPAEGNAIKAANTPNLDKLFSENPLTQIGASGMDVGLPDGQMGNSEVGHTNIGAGRVVYQELTRITKSIQDGDFFENPALLDAVNNALNNGLVMVQVSDEFLNKIFAAIAADPKAQFEVDLPNQTFTICSTGEKTSFEIDGYKKECLLNGYDDVDYLLSIQDDIARFEKARA